MAYRTAQVERIRELLRAGRSYSEIVAEIGCSQGTVSRYAKQLGLGKPWKVYDWLAIRAFYEAGHTRQETMESFRIHKWGWRRAVQRGDLAPKPAPPKVERHRRLPAGARHPKTIGAHSEAMVLAALAATYPVLIPFGENHRYDLVIEAPDGFKRVQVKTGTINKNGSVAFRTTSSYAHHRNGGHRTYRGEVDYFGVYCAEAGAVYLVPVAVVDSCRNSATLRLTPARSGQSRGIRWARDYEVSALNG